MWRRFRPPLALVAAALLGLIALLAVLQYRWLGQISDAERTQRRTTLAAGALEFAQDFDREITRAYLLFQADTPIEPMTEGAGARGPVCRALRSVAGDGEVPAPRERVLLVLAGPPRRRRRPIRRRRSAPVRSGNAPARAGRMAGVNEGLARSTRGRDVAGFVLVDERALHPEDPVGDLGERAGDCRSDTGHCSR